MTLPNCQACNAPHATVWVTVEDCGATMICFRCAAELGDDLKGPTCDDLSTSRDAFSALPCAPRPPTERN